MGRVSLCLVIMFFICSAQKIDAQVQNIREKQDTISATKSLEHIRPENIKKGPLNNALDVLSGQSAGVNVTTNGTDRLAMLNSIRVRGTTSIMGGNDPLVIIDGVTSDIATLSTIYPADIEVLLFVKGNINGHATAHKLLQQKFPCQSDVFFMGKLILQGNLKTVCKLCRLSTLGFFHGVP